MDWNCHNKNIYDKIACWFEMIETEFRRPDILPENVYNMNEMGVMFFVFGSVKVFVSKND